MAPNDDIPTESPPEEDRELVVQIGSQQPIRSEPFAEIDMLAVEGDEVWIGAGESGNPHTYPLEPRLLVDGPLSSRIDHGPMDANHATRRQKVDVHADQSVDEKIVGRPFIKANKNEELEDINGHIKNSLNSPEAFVLTPDSSFPAKIIIRSDEDEDEGENHCGGAGTTHLTVERQAISEDPPEIIAIAAWSDASIDYEIGDTVGVVISTVDECFRAIRDHTSAAGNRPPSDNWEYLGPLTIDNVLVLNPFGMQHGLRIDDPVLVHRVGNMHITTPVRSVFVGTIVNEGPNSEADFTNNNYWVRENVMTVTGQEESGPDDEWDNSVGGYRTGGFWGPVVNIGESDAHGIDTNETVHVIVFPLAVSLGPFAEDSDPAYAMLVDPAQCVGFGVAIPTQEDTPVAVSLTVTITNSTGVPILDGGGQEQTIKLWRNATKKATYVDFIPETIFVYVKFPEETADGYGGSIFSRTEAMDFHSTRIPIDGYPLSPGLLAPAATDITGNAANADHRYVRGHMYMRGNAANKKWAPWFVFDPSAFALVDCPDVWLLDAPGGGGVTNITHEDWDGPKDNSDPLMGVPTAGGQAVITTGNPPNKEAWFSFLRYEGEWDDRHHGQVDAVSSMVYYMGFDVYKVKADGADTTASYLVDAISFEPIKPCLESEVVGAGDKTVKLTHKDWNAGRKVGAEDVDGVMQFLGVDGHQIGLGTSAPMESGKAWLKFERWNYERDAQGHCDLSQDLTDSYYMYWYTIPEGTATGELAWWDNGNKKWRLLAVPGDDAALVFQPGLAVPPTWRVPAEDFQVLQKKADGTVNFDWVRAHA